MLYYLAAILLKSAFSYLSSMDNNLKASELPKHLDEVRYSRLAVNLDYEGFVESLERACNCTYSIAM